MQSFDELFLLDPEVVFLNHGSFGATPRPVFESYQNWQRQLELQPVEFLGRKCTQLLAAARGELARYLCTDPDNLVYVTNATTGLNVIARSLSLGPGDEVLASDQEYGAMDRTWTFLSQKCGFKYINQRVPLPATNKDDIVDYIWEGVTPHTRAIFLSHIASTTSMIFPVETICQRAREAGIITIIDGAHAPGQIPLDLDALGVDFYVGNLHKWLCAPKGSAFLFARPYVQTLIEPLIVSWGWRPEIPGPSPFIDQLEWTGTRDIAAFLAVPDAIRFQAEHDWDRVRESCHALASQAIQRLSSMTGLPPLYPDSPAWFGQMVSSELPVTTDLERLKRCLYEVHHIEVPVIPWQGRKLIRISFQAYNDEKDLESLLEAVRAFDA
jgi:isopenicillin-N epimerase